MSQHTFTAPDGKVVLAGYDRNCGEFFFSVYANYLAEDPLHSSLNEAHLNVRDIQCLRVHVERLVPSLPAGMWSSIRDDAMNDMGNRMVQWDAAGRIKFDSEARTPLAA